MIKILFVCHGNICRSPMAQYVLQDMVNKRHLESLFEIDSAATSTEEIGNGVHYGTRSKLKQAGIPCGNHKARQLSWRDYDAYDFFIGMDEWNRRNMRRMLKGDPEGKVSLLLDYTARQRGIADPWYTGNFDETYNDVVEGCEAFINYLVRSARL
ncbi:MAG: low molecular weight phosphotyrosine protein phosphatase [Blautia sp.]|nr:low molecular weight phosphotyrosine protein phosphatase [Blautia sp.]